MMSKINCVFVTYQQLFVVLCSTDSTFTSASSQQKNVRRVAESFDCACQFFETAGGFLRTGLVAAADRTTRDSGFNFVRHTLIIIV